MAEVKASAPVPCKVDFCKLGTSSRKETVVWVAPPVVNDSASGLAQMYKDLEPHSEKLKTAARCLMIFSIFRLFSAGGMLGFLAACFTLCFAAPGSLGVAYSARYTRILAILSASCTLGALAFGSLLGMHFVLWPEKMAQSVCPPVAFLGADGHGLPPAFLLHAADDKCGALTAKGKDPCDKDDGCTWCDAGAVPPSCKSLEDAKALPPSVFYCDKLQAKPEPATKVAKLHPADKTDEAPATSAPLLGRDGHGLPPVYSSIASPRLIGQEGYARSKEDTVLASSRRRLDALRGSLDNLHAHLAPLHPYLPEVLTDPKSCYPAVLKAEKAVKLFFAVWVILEVCLFASAVATAKYALRLTKKARKFGANAM